MSDAVLQATIKAFDEFSAQFQKFQRELRNLDKAEREAAGGADEANRSTGQFLQTVGSIGGLYAFQRGLLDVISTGREYQLTIKQAQAVTGDFSSTLRDMSMATRGGTMDSRGPRELAQAYRELGAAGADINDILVTTPNILEFGTAAILDMDRSAASVLATAKSFNIALADSGQIVDAYTESMNRGALAGEDFQWIMGSTGAVAKIAGQDFREILSVGSAMRDSGIQAQDAGTSIKAALLQLINPSKEASDLMKELGINVYDASGQMKQWSEITADFEKALAPFNEQSKNIALTTIFGSDGIRAMATSMNKGSGYLREFTDGLKNADGATHKMAAAMEDTFDGAARKTNANLERMKILLFEDVEPAMMAVLEAINQLLLGFNSLDEGTRQLIEVFIGTAGLVAALGATVSIVRTIPPMLSTLSVTMGAAAGPIGWVALAIGGLTAAMIAHKGAQEAARLEQEQNNKSIVQLGEKYQQLETKLSTLKEGTEEYKQIQEQSNSVLAEIEKLMPGVVLAWNSEGQAIAANNDLLRERIALARQATEKTAQSNYMTAWEKQLEIQEKIDTMQKEISNPNLFRSRDALGPVDFKSIPSASNLRALNDELTAVKAEVGKYQAITATGGGDWKDSMPKQRTVPASSGGGGGKTISIGGGGSKSSSPAKAYTEAITEAMYPYKAAVEATTNSLGLLSAQEQYLNQVMQSGRGTANDAIQLNRVRTEQYVTLSDQQAALTKEIQVEQQALVQLQQKYAQATKPEQAQELRQEIENLTRSIAQSGQAWWQAEQQKFTLLQQLKEAEQKRHQDAYQKATELMRHQVNMAQLSTEKQIQYMEKLQRLEGLSQLQRWEIEEDLYRLRKQQLSEYLGELEDEYKDKLDAIDEKTKASIKAIQDQIDALDEKGKDNEREEAARRHNEKLKELQDKRKYRELRTGVEHQKAIADIDKETAEEQRAWELQQQEWSIEDQKDSLEGKLDQVREEGEQERKELEEHYQKARQIAESGIMDVIAALAATEPDWMNTGKDLIDGLIRGLETGDFGSIQKKIDDIRDQVPDTDDPDIEDNNDSGGGGSEDKSKKLITSIGPGSYRRYGDTTAMASRTLAGLLGLGGSVSWDQNTGKVTIGGRSFTPLANENGTTYVGIRQVAEGLGFKAEWDDPYVNIYKAAQGAFAMPKPGGHFFNVAEAGEAELIAPLSKFQPMMNEAVAFAMAKQGGGVIININAPLLHVDSISDEVDVEMVSNKQRKMLTEIAFSRGY